MVPLLALLLAAAPPLHPNSLSSSKVSVRGPHVTVEVRGQAQSVLEVVGPAADADGDALLSQPELDAQRGGLGDYLLQHFRLRVGSGGEVAQGTPLAGRLVELHPGEVEVSAYGEQQWIVATLQFEHDELVPDLLIQDTIFQDVAPDHRDLCELHFNDEPPGEALFWSGETDRYFAPQTPPQPVPLLGWVRMGIGHILSGWDHLAFLVGLLVAAGGLASLLGVITAFTLAHSVTLALAALDVVHVPSRPVEMIIAASIAWVGIADLFQKAPHARWKAAFGFGLVHGLGFAGFLAEALANEPRRLVPLIGFNLGVEAGQLMVVLAIVVILFVARRIASAAGRGAPAPEGPRWLAPRPVRLAAALGVAGAGLYWFAQRAGMLPG